MPLPQHRGERVLRRAEFQCTPQPRLGWVRGPCPERVPGRAGVRSTGGPRSSSYSITGAWERGFSGPFDTCWIGNSEGARPASESL